MKPTPDLVRAWFLRVITWLVPLSLAWWGLGGGVWLLRVLHAGIATALPLDLLDHALSITIMDDHSWKITTSLKIATTPVGPSVVFFFDKNNLEHSLMGYPFLVALLMSTSGKRIKRLVAGLMVMAALTVLGLVAHYWATLTVIVNHRASVLDVLQPPPFTVYAVPYPLWLVHLSSYTYYLSEMIVPFVAPVVIWVGLCQREVSRLVRKLLRRRLT